MEREQLRRPGSRGPVTARPGNRRGGRKRGPQPEAGHRAQTQTEARHQARVARLLDLSQTTIGEQTWDQLIRDWNQLSDRPRRACAATCARDGHVDVQTPVGLWLCVRCLRYIRGDR